MSADWRGDVDVGFHHFDPAAPLDEAKLAMFREYRDAEYAGPFRKDMGSAEILDMVRRDLPDGRRLDVGSGTASLFWIVASTATCTTTACDVEPEALAVLREFLESGRPLPACYYEAAAQFDIAAERVEQLRSSLSDYLVFNALGAWPQQVIRARYDAVTAFGCFAIGGSYPALRDCVRNAASAVRPCGRVIGADWVRHAHLQQRDYSFLTPAAVHAIGLDLGLRVRHAEAVPVRGHATYCEVLLWSYERA